MKRAARGFYLAAFALLGTVACERALGQTPGHTHSDSCAIDPQAIVSDACASFSTLDVLNGQLKDSITSLTQNTDFFSYYRLNLYDKECPFWSDDSGTCGNIACAVNTIDNEADIPPIWRAEELGKLRGPKAQHPNRQMQREREARPLLGELGADVGESCVVEYDDECDERDYCVPEDESATGKGDYVSLVDNPERFTGYSGPGAQQIWEAIYRENCFSRDESLISAPAESSPFGFSGRKGEAAQGLRSVMKEHERQQLIATRPASEQLISDMMELDETCLEKRTFYRIISGMHTSISTHLCWDHLNQTTGQWGPNLQCYRERLHEHPERISNLYFNYALVLRALAKARPALQEYTFCSGDPAQDRATKHKVLALADQIASGPTIYDESLMFQHGSDAGLKEDFRSRFRNVSRTMDCVGCDKCRLWGKVQTNGYGTALKILFEFDEPSKGKVDNPELRRTELVALVNTLDKISHSLSAIAEFEKMLTKEGGEHIMGRAPAEDDGIDEQPKERKGPTFREVLWDAFGDEAHTVLVTFGFVLESWYKMPGELFGVVTEELAIWWDIYIGRIPYPRRWRIRVPDIKERLPGKRWPQKREPREEL